MGASGLIGSTLLRVLMRDMSLDVYATFRSDQSAAYFLETSPDKFIANIDVTNLSSILPVLDSIRPNVVINCIGATKHKTEGNTPYSAIYLNSLFPHQMAKLCSLVGARFIHISTDCVFSGNDGFYSEKSKTDADDVYGKSKALGEIDYGKFLTLRTSTIGHELKSDYGLLNWFLAQQKSCNGYTNAIFSGFPTVIFSEIIRDIVLKNPNLSGLFNVASSAINKYDLLVMIRKIYKLDIDIKKDPSFKINRSLDASRFNEITGYAPPNWVDMINSMYQFDLQNSEIKDRNVQK